VNIRILLIFGFAFAFQLAFSQDTTTVNYQYNSAQTLINNNDGKFRMAGYGEINYNKDYIANTYSNANLDIQRLVLLFGYNFNEKTSFVTEIEYEHVTEVYVEQAFVNHTINTAFNLRGGLLLIPMGIVNEYHEPTTFFGVERPIIDKVIVPTTWREIGIGAAGNFLDLGLAYQIYLVNGFLGYDDKANFNASNGFRGGRQKGAQSQMTSPNLSAKLNYYGVRGLKLGLSGYFGKSQSTLFDGLDRHNQLLVNQADSSVVNINMIGLDAQYRRNAWRFAGQLIYSKNGNTEAYNSFTGSDLGNNMIGYYLQGAYDIFYNNQNLNSLCLFFRYEHYNTQYNETNEGQIHDKSNLTEYTFGLDYTLSDGVVLKSDYQIQKSINIDASQSQLNFGIGFWFK
jgi:hypothetical protein